MNCADCSKVEGIPFMMVCFTCDVYLCKSCASGQKHKTHAMVSFLALDGGKIREAPIEEHNSSGVFYV